MLLVNKNRRNCSVAFYTVGYHHVALYKEKHEQFTPNGREPSSLVLLYKYWWYLQCENKD